MKFPKLKHTWLCAFLIYSPALMLFVFPFFGPLFSGGYDGIFVVIWILFDSEFSFFHHHGYHTVYDSIMEKRPIVDGI